MTDVEAHTILNANQQKLLQANGLLTLNNLLAPNLAMERSVKSPAAIS